MKSKNQRATSAINSSGKLRLLLIFNFRIIRLFLEGKAFPNGFLSAEKQRHHTYDIVNILNDEVTLEEMIKIDPEVFFSIFAKLFNGAPLKFLAN